MTELPRRASELDRLFGRDPANTGVGEERTSVLDRLAVREHGLHFRYIPAGSFLMGSRGAEPDESPIHAVELDAFWITDVPVSWAAFCDLMGWAAPPDGMPSDLASEKPGGQFNEAAFLLHEENKIRLQYCEDATLHARDWHAHQPDQQWKRGNEIVTSREIFGEVPREDPRRPWRYDTKPMVSIGWKQIERLCARLTTERVTYRLPTEAEWEKAARGGLVGCRHAWGDEPPTTERCDFDRFDRFSILPSRTFAPNAYGLYAMNGGVWEWTSDWYDATYYAESPSSNPRGPREGKQKVIRGGSWSDCAEVQTVSFRMSCGAGDWRAPVAGAWGDHYTPNIGFRLVRVETG